MVENPVCCVCGTSFTDEGCLVCISHSSMLQQQHCFVIPLPLSLYLHSFKTVSSLFCLSPRSQRSLWESFCCTLRWSGSTPILRWAAWEKTPKWPCSVSLHTALLALHSLGKHSLTHTLNFAMFLATDVFAATSLNVHVLFCCRGFGQKCKRLYQILDPWLIILLILAVKFNQYQPSVLGMLSSHAELSETVLI